MGLRVINQLGPKAAEAMKAAVPDVEVIDAGADPPPPDLRADVLFGGWGPHSLEYAQHVDWVHLAGTGIDSYPREMFDGRIVTNAPGASAIPIAEFVLAAMLAFEKRLPETWIHEPPEHWNFAPLGWLNTRTLGLVGLGGIGLATAERALPFGMKVRALRRRPEPSPLEGVEVVGSLEELLPESDHLVLAAPATPRTRHLIDAEALALVKPGVHLVNIARGALVDRMRFGSRSTTGASRWPRSTRSIPSPCLKATGYTHTRRCGSAPTCRGRHPRAWRGPSRSSSTTSAATPPASRCSTSSTPTRATRTKASRSAP